MAFVKAAPAPPPDESPARLDSPEATQRRRAARALAGDAGSAPAVAALLATEPEASVREALFGSLIATGGEAVAAMIAPLLHSPDAALRNGALDALKQLDTAADAVVDSLLADDSPDVRLLAIEVTRAWTSARAAPRLEKIIATDPHENVCGAAVDVATEVGTAALLPALEALRLRSHGEPFLVFAVDVAVERIGGRRVESVPPDTVVAELP